MAYGLIGNPSTTKNDRVTFADITLTGEFTINLSCELINDTLDGFIFSGGAGSTGFELYRRGSGSGGNGWQMFVAGSNVSSNTNGSAWPYYDGTTPNPRTIQITRNASNVITVKDPTGTTQLTHTHAGDLKINTLFARGTSFYRGMVVYSLEVINGAFYRKFDASLSGGTGTTLSTTDGLGQGTLFNFPVDNTQWVFFEGGDPEPSTIPEGSGQSVVTFTSAGSGVLPDREPDVVYYTEIERYIAAATIERVVINAAILSGV